LLLALAASEWAFAFLAPLCRGSSLPNGWAAWVLRAALEFIHSLSRRPTSPPSRQVCCWEWDLGPPLSVSWPWGFPRVDFHLCGCPWISFVFCRRSLNLLLCIPAARFAFYTYCQAICILYLLPGVVTAGQYGSDVTRIFGDKIGVRGSRFPPVVADFATTFRWLLINPLLNLLFHKKCVSYEILFCFGIF